MKKFLSVLMIAAMTTAVFAGCSSSAEEETTTEGTEQTEETTGEADYSGVTLTLCTWGGSTGAATQELVKDFEEQYGCTIVLDEVNQNSDRIAKIQSQIESGNIEDDVVYLSGAYAKQGEALGLFEKIDTNVVTNLDELYDFAQNDTGYGPMVCVGRFGIMYNEDYLVDELGLETPTSYMDLFDDKYAGLVALPSMTATAGPYVFAKFAEDLGGDLTDYQAALDLYAETKDNIGMWYTSDIVPALSNKEVAITVYMDLMLPVLRDSGLNMVWVDAEEGNFVDDVYINVVKDAPNKELGQLLVKYLLEKETQEKFIELNNEAPTNKTAVMSEEKDAFLAYGQEEFDNCNFFDYDFLNEIKPTLIEEWQKIVA